MEKSMTGHLMTVTMTVEPLQKTLWILDKIPGGSLDLHEESGLAATQAANLTSELAKVLRPEGEAMRIADHTSTIDLR